MSTSTGGNEARGGAAGIQLPSMEWEMEEEAAPPGPAAAAGAGGAAAAVPAPAEAPTEQVAVPQYGPAVQAAPGAAAPAANVSEHGFGPAEEPGAPLPVGEGPDGPDGPEGAEPGRPAGRRTRFKRPTLVAAATAGVVLMGLPFLITDGADKHGDNRGVNRADPQLVDGPEIDDVQPPAPTDPPTTGLPLPAPVDPPATGDPGALTAPPVDGSGTVPGLALGGGTAGTPAVPAGQPAGTNVPAGKAPQSGTQNGTGGTGGSSTGGSNSKTTQPAAGQPAAQQPGAGQPAPQQPAPGQPAPQQPAPGQPAPQQPAPQQPAPQQPAPQQPAPQQPPASPPPVQPPAAAKATYSAIGGGNCSTASVAYAQHGYWEQGSTGWLSSSTGGYTGSGCNGKYVSMPMSGSDSKDDNDNSVVWTFSTAPVTSGSCTIAVYVPNNSDYKLVGGKPAYYTVQNSSTPNSGVIGDFSVNQTGSRGSWVTSKAFTVSGGKISVMLHSRGLDWAGTATDKAHIAASAVRADCTAS
ncbi:hypothetical protein [Kitasatospora purpeofusca]|uniref:hypothetical protein n=1 Tax=Kitasatospora purpeofusca TaxID=67352 RepID=UPI0035D722DF